MIHVGMGTKLGLLQVMAIRATQAVATLPNGTKSFKISAYNSTAVVKFALGSNKVSSATLTTFRIPVKTMFEVKDVYLSATLIYLSVTGIATSPVGIFYTQ